MMFLKIFAASIIISLSKSSSYIFWSPENNQGSYLYIFGRVNWTSGLKLHTPKVTLRCPKKYTNLDKYIKNNESFSYDVWSGYGGMPDCIVSYHLTVEKTIPSDCTELELYRKNTGRGNDMKCILPTIEIK